MKKTITMKQLKKLVKESFDEEPVMVRQVSADVIIPEGVSDKEVLEAVNNALIDLDCQVVGGPDFTDASWTQEEYFYSESAKSNRGIEMNRGPIVNIPKDRNSMGWSHGTVEFNGEEYKVELKWFDEPSQYGIKKGNISKLWVSDGNNEEIAFFDRGWVTPPNSSEAKAIVKAIIKEFA